MAKYSVESASYKGILKATSLFGGLQVFTVLIQVIKSKIIAVLLGAEGVGIEGLFKSGIELVQSFTGLGLSNSAVRDVAEANGTKDMAKISRIVYVIRRLVWVTGILGLLSFAALSSWLSEFSFGNNDYTISFLALSSVLLLDQICAGQKVVLQGLAKYSKLAKTTAYGTTIGLLVSIPFYYLLGVEGIVHTLILHSVCSLFCSWYFSRSIILVKQSQSARETFIQSKTMVKMGLAMCLSSVEATLIAYLLRSFIRLEGGTVAVGFFQAGFVLMNSYVGLIFNAMGTDFYPRLANVNKDNNRCCQVINEQGIVASCLLTPILVLFVIYFPIIISILYTKDFQCIGSYIMWASLGMVFRLSSWLISFMFLAKGVSKLFILNETLAKIYFFLFNIIGYKYGGLEGLGIAFAVSYVIYTIQVYIIANKKFEFSWDSDFVKLFAVTVSFVVVALIICHLSTIYRFTFGGLVLLVSLIFSYIILDNKIGLSTIVKNKFKKR